MVRGTVVALLAVVVLLPALSTAALTAGAAKVRTTRSREHARKLLLHSQIPTCLQAENISHISLVLFSVRGLLGSSYHFNSLLLALLVTCREISPLPCLNACQ